jgi:hypothetical protein
MEPGKMRKTERWSRKETHVLTEQRGKIKYIYGNLFNIIFEVVL